MTRQDIQAYHHEIKELLDWLDTPKTDVEFDFYFSTVSQMMRKKRVEYLCDINAAILGSLNSGFGPYTWGGRLDLLQWLVALDFVKVEEKDGGFLYTKLKEWEQQ